MSEHPAYPPQDLVCPDPTRCPVAPPQTFDQAQQIRIPAGDAIWVHSYHGTWGYDEENPGYGDTRFAPFDSADGARVPTLYLARDATGALLETVFHDITPGTGHILESTLLGHLVAHVRIPVDLDLVDLRDEALDRIGLTRSAVSASSPEHYPCTRRIAAHWQHRGADGLIWHSRQAEIHRGNGRDVSSCEVIVVFGDPVRRPRGRWQLHRPGIISLSTGYGRTLVDRIAEELDVTVVSG